MRREALWVLQRAASEDAIDSLRGLFRDEKSWRWRRLIKKAIRRSEF